MTFLAPSPADQRVLNAPPNTQALLTTCQQVVAGTVTPVPALQAVAPSTQLDAGPDNTVA